MLFINLKYLGYFIEDYYKNIKCNVYKYLLSISYLLGIVRDGIWFFLYRVLLLSGKKDGEFLDEG